MAVGVLRGLLKTLDRDYTKISLPRQQEKNVPIILHENKWILHADIEGFFDNINHKYLLDNLFLPSLGILCVKSLLTSEVIEKKIFTSSVSGIPQGGIFSPVLANFILNGLENIVYKSIYPLIKSKSRHIQIKGSNVLYPFYLDIVRYTDDFIILCRNMYILETLVLPNLKKFLKGRGLQLSSEKTKLFRLKDGINLKFLDYIFHYEEKWKIQSKIMYSSHVGSRAIALYPDKSSVKIFLEKLKQIFKKSSNLDAYNLIVKTNPILKGWEYYFNMGNCARSRSIIKNLVYKMVWKWAHKKHKKWKKKKIAQFYFLTKETNNQNNLKTKIHKRKLKFQKFKGIKWVFHGVIKSKLRYSETLKNEKHIYLYNINEKGTIVSALVYNVPQVLRKIHAYHPDRLKFIKWSAKSNEKLFGLYLNIKSKLYKKQKGLCFICQKPFEEQNFVENNTHIHHIKLIIKGGSPDSEKNMALVHPLCHKVIDH